MPLGTIPIGSVVRIKKTNEFALVIGKNQLMNNPESFLNYYLEIEDRQGVWAGYDADIELECLPKELQDSI